MKNILLLNLGSSKDIIASAHLISSYKLEYPEAKISMMIYEKNLAIASILENIVKIYTINSEFISTITQNALYPDSFAINEFGNNIEEAMNCEWDTVLNYSNDNASAYFAKALNTKEIVGSYIDGTGTARTTDKWSTYQNYVLTKSQFQTIPVAAVRNHMMLVPLYNDLEKIKLEAEYLYVANQNFTRIRQMHGSKAKYVIGLNLEVGYCGYALNVETLSEIIENLEESSEYKVVLLTSGKSYQKEIVNTLNEKFNNSLVSINVDSVAISAVITNLDAIVSCANNQLAIADALNVKIIEIKNYENKITPTSIGTESFIIYAKDIKNLASDVLLALNEEFETELPIAILNSENPTYLAAQDNYGVMYTQIRGEMNIQRELRYHIERMSHFQVLGFDKNVELLENIKAHSKKEDIHEFTNELKSDLTNTVKFLLAALRSLKGVKNSQSNVNSFIGHLDQLIQAGNQDSIVGSLVRVFEGNIENIQANDINQNMKEIEERLFELKSNLQLITNTITDLLTESVTKDKTNNETNRPEVQSDVQL
jgi:ADP-heptose:LPS heptosyltransferase